MSTRRLRTRALVAFIVAVASCGGDGGGAGGNGGGAGHAAGAAGSATGGAGGAGRWGDGACGRCLRGACSDEYAGCTRLAACKAKLDCRDACPPDPDVLRGQTLFPKPSCISQCGRPDDAAASRALSLIDDCLPVDPGEACADACTAR
jgi:hypothetical protein